MILIAKANDFGFGNIDQWTDHGQIHAVKISFWQKRVKTSFVHQGKQHSFHHIIFVMCISHFIAAQFFDTVVKGSFSQFGTKGTWIGFLALFEDNFTDLSWNDVIGNLELLTQLSDGLQIKARISQIDSYGFQLKALWIELLQSLHGIEKCQAVFSTRDTDGDSVPFLDHLIVIYSLSGQAEKFLKFQVISPLS